MNDREKTAVALLKHVLEKPPTSLVVPDVSAIEVALLVAPLIHVCPACGAEAWCNIDCRLCNACSLLSSYEALLGETQKRRNEIASQIRKARAMPSPGPAKEGASDK